ncbi:MAG: cation transporter dimerization domain-containing protein [Caldisericia bacterium]
MVQKIEDVVNTVPEIHSAYDIRTRYVGAALLVDFSVKVDKEYSIAEGYDIIHRSKQLLSKKIPNLKDVTINLVPTK